MSFPDACKLTNPEITFLQNCGKARLIALQTTNWCAAHMQDMNYICTIGDWWVVCLCSALGVDVLLVIGSLVLENL